MLASIDGRRVRPPHVIHDVGHTLIGQLDVSLGERALYLVFVQGQSADGSGPAHTPNQERAMPPGPADAL